MPQQPHRPGTPPRDRLVGSPARWALAVLAGILVPAGLAVADAPGWLTLLSGVAVAALVVGDLVWRRIARLLADVDERLDDELEEHLRLIALEELDEPTHGRLQPAAEALRALLETHEDPEERQALLRALHRVERLEDELRRTRGSRGASRATGGPRLAGGASSAFQDEARRDDPMLLYQRDEAIPDWVTSPRVRDGLRRVGAVLDDVRILHNADIEWSILLFTLWSRLLIVAGAPLLTALTFGEAPLAGGIQARDVAWLLATAASFATALAAPWIATAVMRRDASGARVRRALLVVEVPIAVAAMVLTPVWPVAAFAGGWTNWWQRPVFNWLRFGAWIAAVCACLAVGMAADGLPAWQIAIECAVALAVIGVIGGSYGAMLPLTVSVLARVTLGGLLSGRRGRARADAELETTIRDLLRAAQAVRDSENGREPAAQMRADFLAGMARALAVRADAGDDWARRAPLGFGPLLTHSLGKVVPFYGSAQATARSEQALLAGEEEPLSVLPPTCTPRDLAELRFAERRHARALSLLVAEIVREAARHGTRTLTTIATAEGERIVLRFANPLPPRPRAAGRGSGAGRLARLCRRIPDSRIDVRGRVPGTFVDLDGRATRFGVQVSFPRTLLTAPSESTSRFGEPVGSRPANG